VQAVIYLVHRNQHRRARSRQKRSQSQDK
jgi:hypothetical protein